MKIGWKVVDFLRRFPTKLFFIWFRFVEAVIGLGSVLGVVRAGVVVQGGGPADEVLPQARVPPLQTLVSSRAP